MGLKEENKPIPTEEQIELAFVEFRKTAGEIEIFVTTTGLDSNELGFWFTYFERPDERWYSMVVEDKNIWVPEDHYRLFTIYSRLFAFLYENGHISMMMGPNITDEARDELRKNPKVHWEDGCALITLGIPDTGFASIRALPMDIFNIQKFPDFDAEYRTKAKASLELIAKDAFEMKDYPRLQEITSLLDGEWFSDV